jgi:hypothetical protein
MTWKELNETDTKLREEQKLLEAGTTSYDKDDVVQLWPPEHWMELPKGEPGDLKDITDAINKVKTEKSKESYRKLVELAKARGIGLKEEIRKCAEKFTVEGPVGGGEQDLKEEDMQLIETKLTEAIGKLREEIGMPAPVAPVPGQAPVAPPPNPFQMMKSMREELDGLKGEHAKKTALYDGYGKALDEMGKRMEAFGKTPMGDPALAEKLTEFLKALSGAKLKEMTQLGQPGAQLATDSQLKDGATPAGMRFNDGETNPTVLSFEERMNKISRTPSSKTT